MSYINRPIEFNFSERHLDDGYYAIPDEYEERINNDTFVFEVDEDDDKVVPDDWVFLSDDRDEANRILALRLCFDNFRDDMQCNDDEVTIGSRNRGQCYLVLTDDEADDLCKKYLKNMVDDVLQIPDNVRSYFDEERWISDVMAADGRAQTLASYDGHENDEEVDGETYYLYRTH